jgi:thymidylate synthase
MIQLLNGFKESNFTSFRKMEAYLNHLNRILSDERSCFKAGMRTGIDTISYFGYQDEYDLSEGFPLVTTKKTFFRGIIEELLWMLAGETNVKSLQDKKVRIWDEWADDDGELGPIYGHQWRKWPDLGSGGSIDQVRRVFDLINNEPTSRRMIVSAWNVSDLSQMALPPCHMIYQFNVNNSELDCKFYQRTADMFLGVPFNVAFYSALTTIFAQETGLKPGRLIHTFGDSHIYCGSDERSQFYKENLDHIKGLVRLVEKKEDYLDIKSSVERNAPAEREGKEMEDQVPRVLLQLSREPKPLPSLKIENKPFDELTYADFTLTGYDPYPAMKKGRVAV